MRRLTPTLLLLPILTASALATPAGADGLNRRWVDADATWLLHVNLEAVMGSEIGRHVVNHAQEFGLHEDELGEFIDETGIDPRKDVGGITVYGRGEPDENSIAIITMNESIDRLIERMQDEPQYHRIRHEGLVFHGWMEDDDEGVLLYVREREGGDGRLVLVSGDPDALARAVRVVDGKAPSIRQAPEATMQATPRNGSLVYAEASELPWLEDGEHPASAIIRQMSRVIIDLGQDEDECYVAVTVSADTTEDADNISDVLQGMIAMGRMIGGSNPELKHLQELCRGLSTRADGRQISVEARFQSGRIRTLLDEAAEMHGGHGNHQDRGELHEDDHEDEDVHEHTNDHHRHDRDR